MEQEHPGRSDPEQDDRMAIQAIAPPLPSRQGLELAHGQAVDTAYMRVVEAA